MANYKILIHQPQYGDSPICLDYKHGQKENFWAGSVTTIQGYGKTDTGSVGSLLEVNVTVITNEDCVEQLKYNGTKKVGVLRTIENAIPSGLSGMFCGQGELDEASGKFRATCKGDSGGPLTTLDPENEDRKTMIGVVSGGRGCGQGIPNWYTRLSHHAQWFNCIINKSVQYLNEGKLDKNKVEMDCQRFAKPYRSDPFTWTS